MFKITYARTLLFPTALLAEVKVKRLSDYVPGAAAGLMVFAFAFGSCCAFCCVKCYECCFVEDEEEESLYPGFEPIMKSEVWNRRPDGPS
jgi:hypothetical protein